MFSKKQKPSIMQPHNVSVTVDGWSDDRKAYLDDRDLKELNRAKYDNLTILVRHRSFILKDLTPKNPSATVTILGAEDVSIFDSSLSSVTTNADNVKVDNDANIALLTATDATYVNIEDNQELLTLFAPKTENLHLRRANVQLGRDMPSLKQLHGGTVQTFARPHTTDVAQNINKVGMFYIAPMLKNDDWYSSMCLFNGHTQSFIKDHKAIKLDNLNDEKHLQDIKDELCKDINHPFYPDADVILEQFVDGVVALEKKRLKPAENIHSRGFTVIA